MALKLFRHTGHNTLLMPGETRLAPHPGWMVLAASLWLGLACNVALWRAVTSGDAHELLAAVKVAGLVAGGSGAILSLLGWRRTLKPAVTLFLLAGAAAACGIWVQGLPVDALWNQRPRSLLPSWTSFLRWQVPALFAVLALLPIVWAWNQRLRRLPGPQQLNANLTGAGMAAIVAIVAFLVPA